MKKFSGSVPKLDLHALTAAEALAQLSAFLQASYGAGSPQAYIVHGKGTGVLRAEVRRYLVHHPLVFHYGEADRFHGGEGATQVIFK